MAGNTLGKWFTVTTFGESHGPAVGCVVDGCPAGIDLSLEDIERETRRRRPGGGGPSSGRKEDDRPEILSGIFEGKTLGTPIAIVIRNTNQNSGDYDELKDLYRPGHADWTWEMKYGIRDHRGGGRTSGRETAGRVAAGAVAKALLRRYGVSVLAWTSAAAGISAPKWGEDGFDIGEIEKNALRMPCAESAGASLAIIGERKAHGDSSGGLVSCRVEGLAPGMGSPVFEKLDALLSLAMLSIGAVKGIEFGSGFAAAALSGSECNDPLLRAREAGAEAGAAPLAPDPVCRTPRAAFGSNNSGGVLGGLSTGSPLEFTIAVKPTPSVSVPQKTVGRDGRERDLVVGGRHDVCICPRIVP
ncbi:MAG: chorismate synthase, partial [Spirochaetaceae bacterium]|nr:chorismate synthase [Spirochaetaceae bacterium]